VPSRPTTSEPSIFIEEIGIARIADTTGFDSVRTVEHHFTPYPMATNPLQFLTYLEGINSPARTQTPSSKGGLLRVSE
jgi:hypothetical protein